MSGDSVTPIEAFEVQLPQPALVAALNMALVVVAVAGSSTSTSSLCCSWQTRGAAFEANSSQTVFPVSKPTKLTPFNNNNNINNVLLSRINCCYVSGNHLTANAF